MSRPAVFLDRDGVINEVVVDGESVRSPRRRDEFTLVEGIVAAVSRLQDAGFMTVVVTNQPDVARGRLSIDDADWFTQCMYEDVGVDLVMECRHDSSGGCLCRKPQPGMLLDAAGRLDLDLRSSFLIGDRLVDIAAAQRAGVAPVLLERWWSARPSSDGTVVDVEAGFATVASLDDAVAFVLGHLGRRGP